MGSAQENKESNMNLRLIRKHEETPRRFHGTSPAFTKASADRSRGLPASFAVACCLLPIASLALSAAVLTGCSKGGDGEKLTLSQKLWGPPPSQLVAWAFDPNDPDKRRQGVVGLSAKSWGLKEPYLKGYAALLKTDKDPLVRAAAVRALGRAQDPNYAPDVTRALLDTDTTVRQDAATALDNVYNDGSAMALRSRAMSDADQDVRAGSCRALRHHHSIAVVRTLVDCLSDKAFSVRFQAHQSLVEVVGKDLGYDPESWSDVAGARALSPQPAASSVAAPWWDWMRVSKPSGEPTTRPAPAAPKMTPKPAASSDDVPWWDWMGVTKAASQPATRPAGTAPVKPKT